MQTLSPSLNRLGASLRALRQAYAGGLDRTDKTTLGTKCLQVVIAQLAQEGLPPRDLQPLVDLEKSVETLKAQAQGQSIASRRRRRPPSEALLARLAAVIDLLVSGGYDEAEAAQLVTLEMLAAGIPLPQQGSDARGWKRLLAWRANLSHGVGSRAAKDEYRDFTRDIEAIPTHERLKRVLDEQLWDRRREPR
jgi:hypothetical protein